MERPPEEKDLPVQRSVVGGEPAVAPQRNGLINTRNLMVEAKDGLVSVYSAPQYQGHVVVNLPPQQEKNPAPQLLNPGSLPQAVDPHFRPNLILCSENMLKAWGDGDCCETTFIEELTPAAKEGLVFADGKFLDLSGEDAKIQTLSCDVDDEDDFQELEVGCWFGTEKFRGSYCLFLDGFPSSVQDQHCQESRVCGSRETPESPGSLICSQLCDGTLQTACHCCPLWAEGMRVPSLIGTATPQVCFCSPLESRYFRRSPADSRLALFMHYK